MQVTSTSIQTQFLTAIDELQANLAQTQNQISTGHSFTSPSQNPIAAGEVNNYNVALAQAQQFDQNASAAQNNLNLEDNALTQAQNTLQSVRSLALQANSSTLSVQNRAAIATQVQQLRDTLLSVANSQNGSGGYLFSGYSSATQPFSLTATGASYAGDQGQPQTAIGAGLVIASGDNGAAVFDQVKTGNGVFDAAPAATNTGNAVLGALSVSDPSAYTGGSYTIQFTAPNAYQVLDSNNAVVTSGTYADGQTIAFSGLQVALSGAPAAGDSFSVTPSANQSVFTTLQNLINVLGTSTGNSAGTARLNNGINSALNNLDQALQQTSNVQASVGSRLNAITAQTNLSSNQELQIKSVISQLQNLDYASAITTLTQQQTSLSAAEQSYTLIQGLSLFKYL